MTVPSLEARQERDFVVEAAAHWVCCTSEDLVNGGRLSADMTLAGRLSAGTWCAEDWRRRRLGARALKPQPHDGPARGAQG